MGLGRMLFFANKEFWLGMDLRVGNPSGHSLWREPVVFPVLEAL